MADVVRRSRGRRRPSDRQSRVHLQTYVSSDVGDKIDAKLERLRIKPAQYLRTLIERDLGLIKEE